MLKTAGNSRTFAKSYIIACQARPLALKRPCVAQIQPAVLLQLFSTSISPSMELESLENTTWDVVISGTGLPQCLLALYVRRGRT